MNIFKYLIINFICLFISQNVKAAPIPENISKQTIVYAQKDTSTLRMDIYRLKDAGTAIQPVMIFIFGGAFKVGTRDQEHYNSYFTSLASAGITTVSIDYRLGLVDRKVTLFNTTAFDTAIYLAVEDLFSATNYLLQHASELHIDASCIMVSGSSAGAITALQADYIIKNQMPLSEMLPARFSYSGILSYAGAIFSHEGWPNYKNKPAPTYFAHGNNDKIVFYNKRRLLKRGMFGSKSLAKRFKKRGFDYLFVTYDGKAHSVALTAMTEHPDIIHWFIIHYVFEGKNWQTESTLKDQNAVVEKSTKVWDIVE